MIMALSRICSHYSAGMYVPSGMPRMALLRDDQAATSLFSVSLLRINWGEYLNGECLVPILYPHD